MQALTIRKKFPVLIGCKCPFTGYHRIRVGLDLRSFDAEKAFFQSELSEHVYMRLPKGYWPMSGRGVRLCRSLYGSNQASRQWHHYLAGGMKRLNFEQCEADVCDTRLLEAVAGSIVVVVHVNDIIAMGLKSRCVNCFEDLNQFVPINNLEVLQWYAG